jgi:hypothetical protein
MAAPPFADLIADPQVANGTALVATTIEALWPAAQYTPIPLGSATRAGKVFEIKAFGVITTAATGTLIITPNVGTATGGATLGASAAITVPASLTFPWFLHAMAVIRTVGSAGTMMLAGTFLGEGVITTGANILSVPFGGTSAAIDTTAASGITIGKTLSVAGSMTTYAAVMQGLN